MLRYDLHSTYTGSGVDNSLTNAQFHISLYIRGGRDLKGTKAAPKNVRLLVS